jgi:hypothetical protein
MNCADAVKALLVATGSWTTLNVLIRKQPWDRSSLSTGGIILSPAPEKRKPASNKKNEVEHAVLVTLLVGSNQDVSDATQLSTLLGWRETARNALVSKEAASAYTTTVVLGTVVVPDAFNNQFDASQFTVKCLVRV